MTKHNIGRLVNFSLFVWFICIPIFWRLDLSKGTSSVYDVFLMAPYASFHLAVFYALTILAIYFSKFSLYHLLLLSLYFPFVQLANYPYLTVRDVFLHGAPAKTILMNGKLSYPKDPRPESWPASFNLHAIFATVLGCDLINANYALYLALVVIFTLVLYCFTKTLENKGYRIACYSSILFLCLFFSHLFDNFHHYSRTALGFTLLFLFFFSFMCLKGRRGYLLQLLVAAATFTTHPFQSLALVSFVIFHYVMTHYARVHNAKRISFVFLLTVAFVGWFLFNGSSTFYEAVKQLPTFLASEYAAPLQETFAVHELLPWWGVILRDFFKYSLITFLAVSLFAVIIVLYKKRKHCENDAMALTLSSFLPMSVVMLLGLLLLPDWQLLWFTPFAAFPVAFSSFLLLENIIAGQKTKTLAPRLKLFSRKTLMTLLLLYVITMSAGVMILRFERNYYLAEVTHPSELSSLSFFFEHSSNSTVHIVSWRTSVYSTYFKYNSSHVTSTLWYKELDKHRDNSSSFLYAESELINKSQYTIRGIREEYDMSKRNLPKTLLKTIDEEYILPEFSQVYSNGFYTIHSRSIHSP